MIVRYQEELQWQGCHAKAMTVWLLNIVECIVSSVIVEGCMDGVEQASKGHGVALGRHTYI